MVYMNRSDVKNHLSPSERSSKRLYRFVGPSDASGFSSKKSVAADGMGSPGLPKAFEDPASFLVPEICKDVRK